MQVMIFFGQLPAKKRKFCKQPRLSTKTTFPL